MSNPVRILHRHDFQYLLNALASRGTGRRADGPRRRDRLRRDPRRVGFARRLDRPAGRRHLPAGTAQRRRSVRLCGRSALLEEVPVPAADSPLAGRPTAAGIPAPARAARRRTVCVPGRAILRAPCDRDSGQSLHGHRPAVSGAPRAGVSHQCELRPGGRDLLLRLDVYRPARRIWFRSRADGDSGRRPACIRRRGRLGAGPGRASDAADRGGWRGRSRGVRALHRTRGPADGAVHGRRRASPNCSPAISSTRAGTKWRRDVSPAPTARWRVRPVSAAPSRTRRISRAITPSGGDRGIRASPWTSPMSTAGACAPPRRRATASG